MKKMIRITGLVLIIIIFTNISCKKDQLQPTWLWLKNETPILEHMSTVHKNNITHIDNGRTTVGEYNWNGDILTLHGPASYDLLASHALSDLVSAYKESILSDTTKLDNNSMLANIIKKYLDLRRKYDANKSFDKMYIAVPKDLYEAYPRFFERFLTDLMWYLTGPIGGDHQNNDGTRLLWVEKNLRELIHEDDFEFKDPWECNCSATIYFKNWYLGYADGPDKSTCSTKEELIMYISLSPQERLDVQEFWTEGRYQAFSQDFGWEKKEFEMQYNDENQCYYLSIPLNATHNNFEIKSNGGGELFKVPSPVNIY